MKSETRHIKARAGWELEEARYLGELGGPARLWEELEAEQRQQRVGSGAQPKVARDGKGNASTTIAENTVVRHGAKCQQSHPPTLWQAGKVLELQYHRSTSTSTSTSVPVPGATRTTRY
jgi:hypothetical protein